MKLENLKTESRESCSEEKVFTPLSDNGESNDKYNPKEDEGSFQEQINGEDYLSREITDHIKNIPNGYNYYSRETSDIKSQFGDNAPLYSKDNDEQSKNQVENYYGRNIDYFRNHYYGNNYISKENDLIKPQNNGNFSYTKGFNDYKNYLSDYYLSEYSSIKSDNVGDGYYSREINDHLRNLSNLGLQYRGDSNGYYSNTDYMRGQTNGTGYYPRLNNNDHFKQSEENYYSKDVTESFKTTTDNYHTEG